jgi:hypothetical protein
VTADEKKLSFVRQIDARSSDLCSQPAGRSPKVSRAKLVTKKQLALPAVCSGACAEWDGEQSAHTER